MTAEEVIRMAMEALIYAHPNPSILRKLLREKTLDRQMDRIGPDIFDPKGRCAALIACRDWLEINGAKE